MKFRKGCLTAGAAMMILSFPFTGIAAEGKPSVSLPDYGKPSYPPQTGEFFPVEGKGYPQALVNPYAHTRTVGFTGAPLEIYTQLNMVTQIQLPSAPVLVNIGKPEGFSLEVVPEFHSLFLKPVAEVEITNLIVTTEKGVYTFILKENPFRPWDIRVVITDPYRNVNPEDPQSLITMAFTGHRMPEFQFDPMDIRSPESSTYVYDPLTKTGCRVVLKRIVFMPRISKAVYWVQFSNVLPPKITGNASAYAIDERGVWTPGLERVAVPGTRTEALPLLAKGDRIDMFLIAGSLKAIPQLVEVRCMLQGSRQLPIVFKLSAAGGTGEGALAPVSTTDQKLQDIYNQVIKKDGIPQSNQYGEVNQPKPEETPDSIHNSSGQNATNQTVDSSRKPNVPGKKTPDSIYYPEP